MKIQDFITQDVLGVPIKVANWMYKGERIVSKEQLDKMTGAV